MKSFLIPSEFIDHDHPDVRAKARSLASGRPDSEAIARACFEFVRDEIEHSLDFKRNPVTLKASEVLRHGTGYCYAKSHLLAALLRENGIPTGLCYQRLSIAYDRPTFCLHGLNAVYLEPHGWYRIDARGNKSGVDAAFTPPVERLAFELAVEGEADLPEIHAAPLPVVVEALRAASTYLDVARNLPDIGATASG